MRNLKRALSLLLSSTMVLGMLVMGSSAASYTDVTSKENVEAIEVLKAVGVMTGDENGNFNPNKQVTRAEMAVVMANLLDLKVEDFKGASLPFTDVPEWAVPYVAACYADGITAGTSATTFAPNSPITREQMAAILYRYAAYKGYDVSQKADLSGYTDAASISGYAKDALAWANAQKLITGVTDTTLNPQGSATRAQVATILMRLCETVVK